MLACILLACIMTKHPALQQEFIAEVTECHHRLLEMDVLHAVMGCRMYASQRVYPAVDVESSCRVLHGLSTSLSSSVSHLAQGNEHLKELCLALAMLLTVQSEQETFLHARGMLVLYTIRHARGPIRQAGEAAAALANTLKLLTGVQLSVEYSWQEQLRASTSSCCHRIQSAAQAHNKSRRKFESKVQPALAEAKEQLQLEAQGCKEQTARCAAAMKLKKWWKKAATFVANFATAVTAAASAWSASADGLSALPAAIIAALGGVLGITGEHFRRMLEKKLEKLRGKQSALDKKLGEAYKALDTFTDASSDVTTCMGQAHEHMEEVLAYLQQDLNRCHGYSDVCHIISNSQLRHNLDKMIEVLEELVRISMDWQQLADALELLQKGTRKEQAQKTTPTTKTQTQLAEKAVPALQKHQQHGDAIPTHCGHKTKHPSQQPGCTDLANIGLGGLNYKATYEPAPVRSRTPYYPSVPQPQAGVTSDTHTHKHAQLHLHQPHAGVPSDMPSHTHVHTHTHKHLHLHVHPRTPHGCTHASHSHVATAHIRSTPAYPHVSPETGPPMFAFLG